MLKFTEENQESNKITTTTEQKIKHFFYSNITIEISGMSNGGHDVWVRSGKQMSMRFENLHLSQAIKEANILLMGEVF
jgi:hypothetical protein